jgi:hypothetical protein
VRRSIESLVLVLLVVGCAGADNVAGPSAGLRRGRQRGWSQCKRNRARRRLDRIQLLRGMAE